MKRTEFEEDRNLSGRWFLIQVTKIQIFGIKLTISFLYSEKKEEIVVLLIVIESSKKESLQSYR